MLFSFSIIPFAPEPPDRKRRINTTATAHETGRATWAAGKRKRQPEAAFVRTRSIWVYSGSSLALLSPDWSLPMPSSYFVLISWMR